MMRAIWHSTCCPSEVISGADVLKSSEASAMEGSIGGTVNLRTASPFDNPGFHGGAHAEGNYNDMSQLYGHKFSAFIENTVLDNTLGFLLGGVVSDNKTRTDSLNAYNQDIYDATTFPFEGGPRVQCRSRPRPAASPSARFSTRRSARPCRAASNGGRATPSSWAWTAYGPSLQDPQIGYNQSYYFPYGIDQNGNGTWPDSSATIQNGLVTGVTSNNFTPEIVNNTINRNVITSLYGLKGSWQPTDKFTLDFDAYRSTANRPEGGTDTFVTAGLVSATPYSPDILTMTDLPHSLPSLNVAIPPSQLGLTACPAGTASTTSAGYCSYNALMNSGFLNNNKYWSTHYDGLNGFSVHDQVTGFTLDGKYQASLGVLDKLLFGLGYNHREKIRVDSSNDWTNGSGQYGDLYVTAGCPVQCSPYTFGSQGFNVISFTNPPNFMRGAGGSYPAVLPKLDTGQLMAFLASLNGKPNPFFCSSLPCDSPFNLADTLPQPNPFNSYDVTEKTYSFYTEATFAGSNWSGNLGVRVVRTTTLAATAQAVPVSLWTPDASNSTQTWNVQYSASQQFPAGGNLYAGIAVGEFELLGDSGPAAVARAAVSETMSRPNLNQLAPNANQQCHQRHAGAGLYRHRGSQAHQGMVRGPVSRVVLQTALGAQCRAVRQEGQQRHLYGHSNQRRFGHLAVHRRTAGLGGGRPGKAVPVDHHRPGQRRQVDLHRRRIELAALPRHGPGHAHAVHPHVEQGLRSVRQPHGRRQCGAARPRSRSA